MKSLFRRKDIRAMQAEAQGDQKLQRALGPVNLTALGIGAIIGGGIFVLTGTVAAQNAGPAVILSFVLAGIASIFAALCYSEFASLVPMSGSAYAYGYATLGEFFAWIIGWDLVLEYAVGAITVAISWSGYMVSFLGDFGIHVPLAVSAPTGTQFINPCFESLIRAEYFFQNLGLHCPLIQTFSACPAPAWGPHAEWVRLSHDLTLLLKPLHIEPASIPHVAAWFNLPAIIIVFIATTLLVVGIKESAGFNNVIVVVKISVILLFICAAALAIKTANWTPFIPDHAGGRHFGWAGIMAGAQIVFFAYIGFDAVSTAAQEAKNPQRDMPIGIIGSLIVCTLLYILVAAVATGVVHYSLLDVDAPIALVADKAGLGWMAKLIKIGAIAGLSSVILVMLYGQSRVFWAMSNDGLLPPFVRTIHPRFRTPYLTSIVTGLAVAFFAAILTVREAGELCSIGTLLAFVIVSVGIVVLRVREPNLPRAFKTPWVWFVGPMGALTAATLMAFSSGKTWMRLGIWLAIGIIIYFCYSRHRSKLAHHQVPPPVPS